MKELMKDLKNKKGFTLVELLAVIVVLAIIILIAMPAVMSAMDKARRNALITEAEEIAKIAQTAFADLQMTSADTSHCYSLTELKKGYMDKNLNNYTGSVYISVENDGTIVKKIWLSNGIYAIENKDAGTLSVKTDIAAKKTASDTCGGTTTTTP